MKAGRRGVKGRRVSFKGAGRRRREGSWEGRRDGRNYVRLGGLWCGLMARGNS